MKMHQNNVKKTRALRVKKAHQRNIIIEFACCEKTVILQENIGGNLDGIILYKGRSLKFSYSSRMSFSVLPFDLQHKEVVDDYRVKGPRQREDKEHRRVAVPSNSPHFQATAQLVWR
jgi:hypothetical protein